MSGLSFVKMHGLGNDFVMLAAPPATDDLTGLIQALCNRHTGIGADGVIWPAPAQPAEANADIQFVYYNGDGSRAEMCGNGIRCFARYLQQHPHYLARSVYDGPIVAQTPAGNILLTLHPNNDLITVDMGPPVLTPAQVPFKPENPVTDNVGPLLNTPVTVLGRTVALTPVSMGNPHAIIMQPANPASPQWLDPAVFGPALEVHSAFPAKTNVEFATVLSRTHVQLVVWERGCGFTQACGTGACATAVAGILNQQLDDTLTISLPGGDLSISWQGGAADSVMMTGPATTVFTGVYGG
jgi:diaminopimelate epimerase